jgi:hypothetical protein
MIGDIMVFLIFLHRSIITIGTSNSMLANTHNLEASSSTSISYRYKRIKDYIYDMEAVLGKGNFSTVYQATRENTSNQPPI